MDNRVRTHTHTDFQSHCDGSRQDKMHCGGPAIRVIIFVITHLSVTVEEIYLMHKILRVVYLGHKDGGCHGPNPNGQAIPFFIFIHSNGEVAN